MTLTYGTRATGETIDGYNYHPHCRGPGEDVVDGQPVGLGIGRCSYASGVHAFVSATADRRNDWQLVVGVEVEPFSIGTLLNPPRDM